MLHPVPKGGNPWVRPFTFTNRRGDTAHTFTDANGMIYMAECDIFGPIACHKQYDNGDGLLYFRYVHEAEYRAAWIAYATKTTVIMRSRTERLRAFLPTIVSLRSL